MKECLADIFHNDIDLSHLMVHDQQASISRIKKKGREAKKKRPHDGGTSKGKFEIQDKPKFKKSFSN